ncbi:MAG TPA: TIGR01777 family oxidoreductase [Pseudogracilibacillus sp.]|nr:TIGR01777 family oxidoreductase [Pseudogracilibacillus sp.]
MHILITGGTGFVGKYLTKALVEKGHHIWVLTRSPEKYKDGQMVTYLSYNICVQDLPSIDAVINLAGESLFGYWTKRKKKRILSSRLQATHKVISLMKQMETKPNVFLTASAVGFYGTANDTVFTEKTTKHGDDFLAHVTMTWEEAAREAEKLGVRTVYTRFGIVLGKRGALPLMSLPIKSFIGGKIGSGQQYISWIHIDDAILLLTFCLFNNGINGPINITAPQPKRNKDFLQILASVLKRPYYLPVPSSLIRGVIGEMSTLILNGQYVLPKKAIDFGYEFKYDRLETALQAIYH